MEPTSRSARKRWIRVAHISVSLAIVVAIFASGIPKFANYADVGRAVKDLTWLEIFVLQTPLGAVTYVIWQRKKSRRKPVPHELAEPAVAVAPLAG